MDKLRAEDMLGKVMLVGLTYYSSTGGFIEQKQFWGTVVQVNTSQIQIQRPDGSLFSLPPDLRSTEPAPPGEYRLRSTGEVVIDPDFLTTWSVTKSDPTTT